MVYFRFLTDYICYTYLGDNSPALYTGVRWWSRRMRSSSARTPKLQLAAEPLIGECWILPKKIPHIQGQRRSPRKMVGGAKSHLESNPLPARDVQRAQTNLVPIRTQRCHRDWARTVSECLLQRYRSAVDCHRAGTLGAADLGTT